MPELIWNLDTLILYLSHSTLRIPEIYRERVFRDMSLKLKECEGFEFSELHKAIARFYMSLEEYCVACGETIEPGDICCEIKRLSVDKLPPLPPSPAIQGSHPDHSALEELSYSEPPHHAPT